jgi:hypothetical protein
VIPVSRRNVAGDLFRRSVWLMLPAYKHGNLLCSDSNLYHDLLDFLGRPTPPGESAAIYASACRFLPADRPGGRRRLEEWDHPLTVGQPLPALPLWLSAGVSVPLELGDSYEETCRVLGIP